jgi:TPP-dependent pyruvate/acetoin dehydrogenase alpha subunit
MLTKDELIEFETDIAAEFEAGKIPYPVHLAGGNEDQLIEIFKSIAPEDWVFCSWRSHYHALLKGVPKAVVRDAILGGKSISLCFPDYRVFSSGIVGGACPIAVGVAQSIKWRNGTEEVWCFIGDMTARCGLTFESHRYADGHNLPLTFVVEDNGLSVCTITKEVWGYGDPVFHLHGAMDYDYKLTKPHVGIGKFVKF